MRIRFISAVLVALALMAAPLGMIGSGGVAMAHGPVAASSQHDGHCAGSEAPGGDTDGSKAMLDCMSICSAIAGSTPLSFQPQPFFTSNPEVPPLASLTGIHPESDPPPPRLS